MISEIIFSDSNGIKSVITVDSAWLVAEWNSDQPSWSVHFVSSFDLGKPYDLIGADSYSSVKDDIYA